MRVFLLFDFTGGIAAKQAPVCLFNISEKVSSFMSNVLRVQRTVVGFLMLLIAFAPHVSAYGRTDNERLLPTERTTSRNIDSKVVM